MRQQTHSIKLLFLLLFSISFNLIAQEMPKYKIRCKTQLSYIDGESLFSGVDGSEYEQIFELQRQPDDEAENILSIQSFEIQDSLQINNKKFDSPVYQVDIAIDVQPDSIFWSEQALQYSIKTTVFEKHEEGRLMAIGYAEVGSKYFSALKFGNISDSFYEKYEVENYGNNIGWLSLIKNNDPPRMGMLRDFSVKCKYLLPQ